MSQAFNLKLLELVRGQPQIWNRNEMGYQNNHYEVWKQIAAELGVTPEQAIKKWTNMRSHYSQYLRNIRDGKRKTFHLSKAMDFLRPHVYLRDGSQPISGAKIRGQENNSGDAREPEQEEDSVEAQEEFGGDNGWTSCAFAVDTGSQNMMVDSRNRDAMFLLGLLPEMGRMSPAEKRLFKQRALELSQELLDGVEVLG